ncbi:Protein kinase domain containing protein [Entamoeba marina]
MTLNCTTKVLGMKIQMTFYFSKSKDNLNDIAELLKNKTFENWDDDSREKMNILMKNIKYKYHGALTIQTDAVNSVSLDMDEIQISEIPIGEGSMGKVFFGKYRTTYVAVKTFHWEDLSEEEMTELKKDVVAECDMLAKLRNPFVVNYIGSVTYIPQVSMVTVFFELGSLQEYIHKDNQYGVILPFKLKTKMLFDTARGMNFLHANSILHLDLKPDNLLVNSLYSDSACVLKITDFGTSRLKQRVSKEKGLGTPTYVAPESYTDNYSSASDVFSFAVTAWELFYGVEPYSEFKSLFEIKDFVKSEKRLEINDTMPESWKSLIEKCWTHNPENRPSFSVIINEIGKFDNMAHPELDEDVNYERIDNILHERKTRYAEMLN